MSLEIPQGSAAPEQPQTTTDQKEEKSSKKTFSYKLWIIPVLLVLIVAGVLIGVLPDWNNDDTASTQEQLEQLENQSNATSQPASTSPSTSISQQYLESSNGPFDVKLPLFSSRITEGYSNDEDLKHDLNQAAGFLLNGVIISNRDAGIYVGDNGTSSGGDAPMAPPSVENGLASDGMTATSDGSESAGGDAFSNVNSFETNNQEFTIDRADFVKSDGNLVFAAYSDYLLVWSATTGPEIITKIRMPALNVTGYYPGPIVYAEAAEAPSENSTTTANAASDTMPSMPTIWWNPKPRIEALLIHENRLTVVISGYGAENIQQLGYVPILYDYLGTRVQVYDINNGALSLVSQTDVNGAFRNAYSVDQDVYIVTQSNLNTWEHLVAPVERWQPQYAGLDDAAYVQSATAVVDDGLVDAFIDRLLSELRVNGDINLARLSVFADAISEGNVDESLYSGGIANAVTQVVSFDMTQGLTPQITGTFHPGSWAQVYAMGSMIVIADQSWSWIEADGQSAQKTYLVCFRLNGPSSSPAMVGSVDGYILNPYSLDYVEKSEGSYVRIATTQSFWTPWVGTMEGDMMGGDAGTSTGATSSSSQAVESNTINQIIVLRVPGSADASGDLVLQQVGSLELGEPNEMFTAVRFFDNFAYAVTFEQTDPFYVVDLTSEQPVKVGELKVTGFSQYLHPIDSNDQYLVSLGQESDTDGNIIGLQISLFDATSPSNPVLVNRLVVEQDENTWSDSSASWDERAFRYVSLGDRTGKVIIPFSMYSWQEFDETTGEPLATPVSETFEGFSVFDIANGEITKDFDIDHSFEIPQLTNCSYWYDWLPERSFVFSGKLMTMKKYTIISTDLSSGATLWTSYLNNTIPPECDAGSSGNIPPPLIRA